MKRLSNRGFGRREQCPCLPFGRAVAAVALCIGLAVQSAWAVQPAAPDPAVRIVPTRAFLAPELAVTPDLEPGVKLAVGRYVPMKPGAQEFLQRAGGEWELRWDRRTDRPNLVQGSGIALIPGKGNTLTAAGLGLGADRGVDIATVETRLRAFIATNADFLQAQGLEFRLDADASTPYGDGSTHWFVEFAQYAGGVRVDRAKLFFRLSHGNLVQFGEELVAPVTIDTRPSIGRTEAFNAAWQQLAFPAGARIGETIEAGELRVLPMAPSGEPGGEAYTGPNGAGYMHRLAWRFVFRIDGDAATWEVLFDAHAKSVIAVRDLTVNVAATVTGGIYPTTNSDAEIVVPMPYASVTNGTTKITDVLGIYDYSGGTATLALNGKYFKMSDNCGAISLASTTDGNLALGTSGGTDCTTPGVGGAGNTHASRSGFYHLTNINRKAVTFFPTNSWLASTVTANMNINNTCNASWNGTSLNFYKSGGGCSNTGEIAAVFLHEWGHGMDTNTGGAASEYGSGEAVGDTFAFLETRDACIGKNFKPGVPCRNCDATCTGVRDLKAFSTHGAATIARPATITSTSGADCARFACPYLANGITPYQGPMGYEGHCESYIASSANWDLAQALIEQYGPQQGWQQMDKIWYGSLVPSKSAYQVVSGGKCNINATVNGCGSSNWYTVFLAADDDDGNLANGTPNACRIWDAFDAHGIACGVRPACTGTSTLTVGGNVSGLAGSGLVLSLNGSTSLPVNANGAFTFPGGLASGATYAVTVATQPASPAQTCTVANGSGTIGAANVTNVAVSCTTAPTYTVGGSASGLAGAGLVLKLNGGNDLPVAANGAFTFPGGLVSGAAYAVTVDTQPVSPAQTCTVANGSGTIGSANVTDVAVTCSASSYTVGGTVSGLSGAGLVLQLNGGGDLAVGANGAFTFAGALESGSAYAVTLGAQPAGQACSIANGSGTVGNAHVTNVAVTCTAIPTYTVGGRVSGLVGSGLVLQLNGSATLPMSANGLFVFTGGLPSDAPYAVTVATQPTGPAQTCSVTNGSGTIATANVSNVAVSCTIDIIDRIFANGFEQVAP